MKKTKIRTGELQQISITLFQNWDMHKDKIDLTPRALYQLIALKRVIETQARNLQDTVNAMAEKYGGIIQPNGGFSIPDNRRDELQNALNDFAREEIELEYQPVRIGDNDKMPIELMDILFQFLELAD